MSTLSQSRPPIDPRPTGSDPSAPGQRDGAVHAALLIRVDRLRRRAQRLLWCEAAAVLAVVTLLVLLASVLVDWWWRPSELAGRVVISGMGTIGVCAAVTWFVRLVRRRRITRAAVARRLESLEPRLGDRLSSALSLGAVSSGATAPKTAADNRRQDELADEAIRRAADELDAIEPERHIARWSAVRAVLIAIAAGGMVALWAMWNPHSSSLAARRLLIPTADVRWPQRNELRLENLPRRVHEGSDVEIFVRDARGQLPADAEIQFRDASGTIATPPLKLSGESGSALWQQVTEDFEVRARGGDDHTMSWRGVKVVASPEITEFSARLRPPDYTGRPAVETLETRLTVLSGTEISIRAAVVPGVADATFVRRGSTRSADGSGTAVEQSWPVNVENSGTVLSMGPIPVQQSGQYRIAWIDRNQLSGMSDVRWDITVQRDEVPRVELAEPREDIEITPMVAIVLRQNATDDFGLAEVRFEIRHLQNAVAGQLAAETLPNQPLRYTAKADFTPREWLDQRGDDTGDEPPGTAESADPRQSSLAAGDTLEITAVAVDSAGQRGQSTTRRLRVVTRDAMLNSLARVQREAMEELRHAADDQRIAMEQTEAAANRLGGDEAQQQAARDRLQAAESAQTAVDRRIRAEVGGVQQQIDRAIDQARANGIAASELEAIARRVDEGIAGPVSRARESLASAVSQLTDEQPAQAGEHLRSAAEAQQAALDQLEQLVSEMRRDDTRRALAEQLGETVASQTRLREATQEASGAADPEQETARLAAQQRELARQAEALAERLSEMADSLQGQEPTVAEQARAAAAALQSGDQRAADTMRQAAEELSRQRTGRAEDLQQQAAEQLEQARQQLSGSPRPPNTPVNSSEAAENFAVGVQKVTTDQQTLVEEIQNVATDAHSPAQNEIGRATRDLAARDELPPGFSAALEDAAADMDHAAALLRRPGSQEAAVDPATSALERLQFIRDSLAAGPAAEGSTEPGESAGGENAAGDQTPPPVPLSTLKLVRATQEFLRQRTGRIAEQEGAGDLSAIEQSRIQAMKQTLAEEQSRLVQRIEDYATQIANRPAPADPEPAPAESAPTESTPDPETDTTGAAL